MMEHVNPHYYTYHYEKGKPFEPLKDVNTEGILMELTPHGFDLILLFDEPTEDEIKQVDYDCHFEIRHTVVYDKIIFFTFKAGNLPWQAVPYTPHLVSPEIPELSVYEEIPVVLYVVDLKTKIIKSNIRQMYLGKQFTECLIEDDNAIRKMSFSRAEYDECINFAQMKYPPEKLMANSRNACYIRGTKE